MPHPPRRILAVETSGRTGSAAIGTEAGLVASACLSGDMKHAGELIPSIQALLEQAAWPADSLTDVFVSIGPGSFTGLRIGVILARTLGWSIGARIVAVPTVDALARNALSAEPVPAHLAVVLDAKRSQVFAAAFRLEAGVPARILGPHLADPGEFLRRCPRPLAVLGEGIPYHRQAIADSGVTVLEPDLWSARAENVLRAGLDLAAAGLYTASGDLVPLYIRRPEAEEKWEKLHPDESHPRPKAAGGESLS